MQIFVSLRRQRCHGASQVVREHKHVVRVNDMSEDDSGVERCVGDRRATER